ncbi:MAG: FHA domain-containing protein [Desulfobacterales bacterium]|nr:FHA domain-containing protein [Desulfobacterales bacterium]
MKSYLIKILSGTNLGAEFIADENVVYTIGSSDECDIILQDKFISQIHLSLQINSKEIVIKLFDNSKIFIDGKEIESEEITASYFSILTIGTTNIIIGPENADWIKKESEIQEKKDDTSSNTEKIEFNPQITDNKVNKSFYLFVFITIIIISFGSYILFFYHYKKVEKLSNINKPDNISFEDYLKKLNICFKIGKENNIKIYVKNPNESKEIKNHIKTNGSYSFIDLTNMIESCKEIIAIYKLPINIISNGCGNITLTGYAEDIKLVDSIIQKIHQDVYAVEEVVNNVLLSNKIIMKVSEILESFDLIDDITVEPYHNYIKIAGSLSYSLFNTWTKAKEKISKEFGESICFEDQVKIAHDPAVSLNLDLTGIYMYPTPYFITSNGNRYFEGSTILDNYIVKSINYNKIIFIKNNEEIHYKF